MTAHVVIRRSAFTLGKQSTLITMTNADIDLLNSPLPCKRSGCPGHVRECSLRDGRALCEYGLRHDPNFLLRGECSACGMHSEYSYSEIINRIPSHLRPRELPEGQLWALVLLAGPPAKTGDRCFVGERVLIQTGGAHQQGIADGYWIGRLLSPMTFALSVPLQSMVAGGLAGDFFVCTDILDGLTRKPFPVQMPAPSSSAFGMFVIPPSANTMLATTPFCRNPSCGHIFGLSHSQFLHAASESQSLAWFWRGRLAVIAGCERCGTSKVVDEQEYAALYKV